MIQSTQKRIAAVVALRPLNAFNPCELIHSDIKFPEKPDQPIKGNYYWPPDEQLLWFHTYCQENNVNAKIVTQFLGATPLPSVPDSSVEGQSAQLLQEHWKATILVDGQVVSEGDATGFVKLNSWEDRKYSSNQTRKYAIGAALSQYGFGAKPTFPMEDEEIKQALLDAGIPVPDNSPATSGVTAPPAVNPAKSGSSAPVAVTPSPSTVPQNNTSPAVMQDSFFGNNGVFSGNADTSAGCDPNALANVPMYKPQVTPPASTTVVADDGDPVALAKQVVWPGKGKFAGKSLGEILSEPGGMKNLAYIVNDYNARSEDGQKVKAAAKLILDNLATGK